MSRSSPNQTRNCNGRILDAIKVARKDLPKAPNDIAYYVVRTAAPYEQRAAKRQRTRLRVGKILDPTNPLLVDCQIFDRSKAGARLRLFAKKVSIPLRIWLFDEIAENLIDARVVWRRNREVGICFAPLAKPRELTATQLVYLRAGYNVAQH